LNIFAMHHSPSSNHLALPAPAEIVISDELGVVERIPMGPITIEKEMTLWMMTELTQSNKELQEQLAAQKKKWYVITAGIATTVIPLVIVGIEFWNVTQSCD
jgi:hypothetical protein